MEILDFLVNLKDLMLSFVFVFMPEMCSQEYHILLGFNVCMHQAVRSFIHSTNHITLPVLRHPIESNLNSGPQPIVPQRTCPRQILSPQLSDFSLAPLTFFLQCHSYLEASVLVLAATWNCLDLVMVGLFLSFLFLP